jgi:hypothetical protein
VHDLALRHQVFDCARDVLDRDLWIDTVLVKQIDSIGAQALQHAVDGGLDVLRSAVETRQTPAGLKIDVPTELRCDHHPVAERRDASAEDTFDLVRALSLGRVEEGDAAIIRSPDDVQHLWAVGDRGLVSAAHVLNAEADAGDLQVAEPPTLAGDRLDAPSHLRTGGHRRCCSSSRSQAERHEVPAADAAASSISWHAGVSLWRLLLSGSSGQARPPGAERPEC